MPNVVQKYARLFVKRIRRVTSSPSQIVPHPGDVIAKPDEVVRHQDKENSPAEPKDITLEVSAIVNPEASKVEHKEEKVPQNLDIFEDSTPDRGEDSSSGESDDVITTIDDITKELEGLKTLRIEDAIIESRKMQNTINEIPPINARRLMKELILLRKASSESNGTFEVNPCPVDGDEDAGTNLSEWEVVFYKFDENSNLWKSMQDFNVESVKFRVNFPEDFPFSPPFVRLISPYIENGFVMNGGAICLEVLTNQGWCSAYTVEALIVQVAAALAHGGAVVSKHQKRKQHKLTKKRAEVEFQRIVKIHNKYGWVTLEKDEG